jgi:LysM repeat protein
MPAPAEESAPAEGKPEAPAPTAEVLASVSGTHFVQRGDTLSELALLYNVEVEALKLINGLTSDVIYAGQTLAVPRPDEASRVAVSRLGDGGLIRD